MASISPLTLQTHLHKPEILLSPSPSSPLKPSSLQSHSHSLSLELLIPPSTAAIASPPTTRDGTAIHDVVKNAIERLNEFVNSSKKESSKEGHTYGVTDREHEVEEEKEEKNWVGKLSIEDGLIGETIGRSSECVEDGNQI